MLLKYMLKNSYEDYQIPYPRRGCVPYEDPEKLLPSKIASHRNLCLTSICFPSLFEAPLSILPGTLCSSLDHLQGVHKPDALWKDGEAVAWAGSVTGPGIGAVVRLLCLLVSSTELPVVCTRPHM